MDNLEDIAYDYLEAKREATAAAARVKKLKGKLDSQLSSGDEISVDGTDYFWSVSTGSAPRYKEVLDWLHPQVGPDVMVLIEEGQDLFTGQRVTKDLKPVE